jgi:hypothetical protein
LRRFKDIQKVLGESSGKPPDGSLKDLLLRLDRLLQGSVKIDPENFQDEVFKLSNKFLEIEHIIDDTLAKFKQ